MLLQKFKFLDHTTQAQSHQFEGNKVNKAVHKHYAHFKDLNFMFRVPMDPNLDVSLQKN